MEKNKTSLNDLVNKVIDDKLASGEIYDVIAKKVDNVIETAISDIFSSYRDTSLSKLLKEELEPILGAAIKNANLSKNISLLTTLIDKLCDDREMLSISRPSHVFDDLLGKNEKLPKIIKLSEIFEKYTKWLENELESLSFDKDNLDFDDGYAYVEFDIELDSLNDDEDERREHTWYSDSNRHGYILTCTPVNEDDLLYSNDMEHNIIFYLRKSYSDKSKYNLEVDLGTATINDLINMPAFVYYLYRISREYVLIELDKGYFSDTLSVSVDQYD